jgi:hypothetical protein
MLSRAIRRRAARDKASSKAKKRRASQNVADITRPATKSGVSHGPQSSVYSSSLSVS